MHHVPSNPESVFTYGAPALKFGLGASDEIGHDLQQYGARRVLVVTDPGVAATGHPQRVADQVSALGTEAVVFEDSPNGVHAARSAGIFVVAVPNSVTSQLSIENADLTLRSLTDLSLRELLNKVK